MSQYFIMIFSSAIFAISTLLVTGCENCDEPTAPLIPLAADKDEKVTVALIARFDDELAFSRKRGIYLIKDETNGRRFIGVSGVGIAETGSHKQGKITVNDER